MIGHKLYVCSLQGCAQVSLAEYNIEDSTLKWYNILSFRFIQNYETLEVSGACKEESSDESTIISSQTSTLTRNQGKCLKKKIFFI